MTPPGRSVRSRRSGADLTEGQAPDLSPRTSRMWTEYSWSTRDPTRELCVLVELGIGLLTGSRRTTARIRRGSPTTDVGSAPMSRHLC